MKNILLITLILFSKIAFTQINGVIVNANTKEKIPFVNIWVENENTGTTSNEKGYFILDVDRTKTIIFSAIGFEKLAIKGSNIKNIVVLKPKIIEFPEIFIEPTNQNKELVIGKFKKSKIRDYFGGGTKPWIIARYFPYNSNYSKTKFLNKICILTKSFIKNANFKIRLYAVNEKGEPKGYIYNKNILGIAKKGKKITEINLRNLNIEFPKKGFFIAVEWLIIESNKYEFTYTMKGNNRKLKAISYQPNIGTIPTETNMNTWIFSGGKWQKIWKNNGRLKHYKEKYNLIAIELTLSN